MYVYEYLLPKVHNLFHYSRKKKKSQCITSPLCGVMVPTKIMWAQKREIKTLGMSCV